MTDQEHIEAIIQRTFAVIQDVYDREIINGGNKLSSESRIIFPMKRDTSVRVSEQELRFIFVEQLNKEIIRTSHE